MASDVQHCNMALSHIGSDARVSSINPPDGSVEAGHCKTFYDVARTEMLEMGNWAFSLKRATLASVTNESTTWAYAYALPSDCLSPRRVFRAGAGLTIFNQDEAAYSPNDDDSADYTVESGVLYTNEPEAVLMYVRDVTDTTKFTPSFSAAFSYLLSSYIAGPVLKGNEGLKVGDGMRNRATALASASMTNSANASTGPAQTAASIVAARA